MAAIELASTTDALADEIGKRLTAIGTDVGVSLMVIGDEGVEDRQIGGSGETVNVRFEMVEDVAALLAGEIGLPGLVYVRRAELDGPSDAVNAVAPAVGLSAHRFMPYITRARILSDADLQAMIDEEGIPSLLRRFLQANSFAYTVIDLVSHIGAFRTRWRVGEHEMDSVADDAGVHIAELDPSAEVGSVVTFEPLAWMRWLGTTCAPPPTDEEAANEVTFIEGLLAGKFTMEGNTHSLEAVSRLRPHSR